ncbi:MAG: hypothetical protein WBX11_02165 [Thiobacillaceae bacterium]
MNRRSWLTRIVLAASAVAIILAAATNKGEDKQHKLGQKAEQPVHVAMPQLSGSRSHALQSSAHIELERLHRESGKAPSHAGIGNAFNVISWYVPPPPPPPPPPPKPVPPPAPTAPPMPFTYMGQYEEGGKLIIFLVKGDRIYTVSEGEVIDDTYRVEHLKDGFLELTYLPLNIKQTIGTGAS